MLRMPGNIGMRSRASGANSSRIAGGNPAVSQPNTSTSSGRIMQSWSECVPWVVRACQRRARRDRRPSHGAPPGACTHGSRARRVLARDRRGEIPTVRPDATRRRRSPRAGSRCPCWAGSRDAPVQWPPSGKLRSSTDNQWHMQKRLLIEGWRFIPHSYALVAQAHSICLLQRGDIDLRFRDLPYYYPAWRRTRNIFPPADEEVLQEIRNPDDAYAPDVTLRICAEPLDVEA